MSCFYPRLAIDFGIMPETGKHRIKFVAGKADWSINDYRSRYGDMLLMLPCGQCLGCQFDKARDWATRCVLEASYYENNSFITLTYDDVHLPKDGKDVYKHVIALIRSLRDAGHTIRYFGCVERGTATSRLHAHVLIFGFMPSDIKFFSIGADKNYLYTSKYMTDLWNKGHVIIGHVSNESAGYVARYTTKKVSDDSFIFMSNRPGIGYQYLVDNKEKIIKNDAVFGAFGHSNKALVPRYFNRFLSEWYPDEYLALQKKRLEGIQLKDLNSMIHLKVGHLEQKKIHDADVAYARLKRIGRGGDFA